MRVSLRLMVLPAAIVSLNVNAQEIRTGAAAYGNWDSDAPGAARHITRTDLPSPSLTENDPEAPDFEQMPALVGAQPGQLPSVPKGFSVQVFAQGLKQPRVLRIAPNGDIFVAESGTGRVLVFAQQAKSDKASQPEVFADKLERPFGIAFYPSKEPQYVYVAAANQVVRYPYSTGAREAKGPPEIILSNIPTTRHWTRDLAVSSDNQRIFVSIGSASNVASKMPDKTQAEIQAHERTHGVGAAWGAEENRAVVRVFGPDGKDVRNYATGLRNCSGMTIQPGTGTLWCTGNERDHIGPNLPPDYLTRIQEGGFYGWPWYYAGPNEDPAHLGKRPDLKDKVLAPDVLLQPHSSTMQLIFYDSDAFPGEYRGDIFATLHGSWNRQERTGYKVIRARMNGGQPTGVYEDFMTGFVLDKDTVWGRPTGIAVASDGSLLVTDDANGTIFRVTHDAVK